MIELLAVIVILGVLMLIAVPSISNVITNSRKDSFIRSTQEYIEATKNEIIAGTIPSPLLGTSTYIKVSDLVLGNGSGRSPFDALFEDEKSYIKVTNVSVEDKVRYEYSIALSDEKNNCIALTNLEELDRSKVGINCHIQKFHDGYLSFDGKTDYIDLGLENYSFGQRLSFVIRFSTSQILRGDFLGNWEGAGGGMTFNNNQLYFEVAVPDGIYKRIIYDASIVLNQFATLVGTYDGSYMRFYHNGVLVSSLAVSGNMLASPCPFLLGTNPGYSSDRYNFALIEMTDAYIFDRTLTQVEIATSFSGRITDFDSTGLVTGVRVHS